jgi:Glycosyl hydrolase family 26
MRATAALVLSLAALIVLPAVADARAFGIAGTAEQYTALKSLHPTVRADYIEYGDDLVASLQLDRLLHAVAMITWTDDSTLTLNSIVDGQTDAYLRREARAVRAYHGLVYIRFAQEMNGNWFPWSGDPAVYVAAWRHIWNVFHAAGATNVRWIWGPDLLTNDSATQYANVTAPYWPGARYVNIVGPTMVEFAFETDCEVACRFARIDWLHSHFDKPVWLAETKVDAAERYPWLVSLRTALAARPWVSAVIWSETSSRGQALGQAGVGNMDWTLTNDPRARKLLTQVLDG